MTDLSSVGDSGQWQALADRILGSSIELQSGENLLLSIDSIQLYPLAEALAAGAISRGAHSHMMIVPETLKESIRQVGSDAQASRSRVPEISAMSWADTFVDLRAMAPPTPGAKDESYWQRAALLKSAHGEVSTARWSNTRWCVVRVPTSPYAEFLHRPVDEFVREFFEGTLLEADPNWADLADRLRDVRTVRIQSADTDLSFSVAGRRWVLFDGKRNLPDGEIATAPLESSATGDILFSEPLVFGGCRVEGLRLRFDKGRATYVDSVSGGDFVQGLLASDEGAVRIGEFGLGLNPALKSWTEDLFFDEKIRGTVHIALGRSYPECGGVNDSLIHWDIVKDLRRTDRGPGGNLFFDGVPVIERGEYLLDRYGLDSVPRGPDPPNRRSSPRRQ